MKVKFQKYVVTLRDFPVPRVDFEQLLCGVLELRRPEPLKPHTREANDWSVLSKQITDLCTRYATDLGENAYSVFNAVTEFASHPPANRFVTRERLSLQRSAGEWIASFSDQVRSPQ